MGFLLSCYVSAGHRPSRGTWSLSLPKSDLCVVVWGGVCCAVFVVVNALIKSGLIVSPLMWCR